MRECCRLPVEGVRFLQQGDDANTHREEGLGAKGFGLRLSVLKPGVTGGL